MGLFPLFISRVKVGAAQTCVGKAVRRANPRSGGLWVIVSRCLRRRLPAAENSSSSKHFCPLPPPASPPVFRKSPTAHSLSQDLNRIGFHSRKDGRNAQILPKRRRRRSRGSPCGEPIQSNSLSFCPLSETLRHRQQTGRVIPERRSSVSCGGVDLRFHAHFCSFRFHVGHSANSLSRNGVQSETLLLLSSRGDDCLCLRCGWRSEEMQSLPCPVPSATIVWCQT